MDHSVRGAKIFPEIRGLKKLLVVFRYKRLRKQLKLLQTKFIENHLKEFYAAKKRDVYHSDDISSLGILELKDYGPENNTGYEHVLVVINNFSVFGWTVFLKNKSAQRIKDSLENILMSSKSKPSLIESDRGKDFYNNFFQNFLNNNNIKHFFEKYIHRSCFAENFKRTIRNLLKKLVFERGDGNWIKFLSTVTKHYNNRIHLSTKLTPIQASFKKNEGFVYQNLLDQRNKTKPKFQVNDSVRVADLKKLSQRVIQGTGLIIYTKIQKLLMIQNQGITLIIYRKGISKPCWKRQSLHWKKINMLWEPWT